MPPAFLRSMLCNLSASSAEYSYDSYGNTLTATGTQAASNAYRYSTKELHSWTGFYDYGYRFYSPSLGRWINRDPIEEAGGLNLYQAFANDPINLVDPYGLTVADGLAFIGGALQGAGGQFLEDRIAGRRFNYDNYAGAMAGGGVSGVLTLRTKNPAFANAAGNVTENLYGQWLKNISGEQQGYDFQEAGVDGLIGAASGPLQRFVPGIKGLTKGNGSWSHVAKTTSTKLNKGLIKNLKPKTAGKMLGSDAIQGMAPGAFDAGVKGGRDRFNNWTSGKKLKPQRRDVPKQRRRIC